MAFDRKGLEQSVNDLEQAVSNLKRLQQIADSAKLSEEQLNLLCRNLNEQAERIGAFAEQTTVSLQQFSETQKDMAGSLTDMRSSMKEHTNTVSLEFAQLRGAVFSKAGEIDKQVADGFSESEKQQAETRQAVNALGERIESLRAEIAALKELVKDYNAKTRIAIIASCVAAVAAIIAVFV